MSISGEDSHNFTVFIIDLNFTLVIDCCVVVDVVERQYLLVKSFIQQQL